MTYILSSILFFFFFLLSHLSLQIHEVFTRISSTQIVRMSNISVDTDGTIILLSRWSETRSKTLWKSSLGVRFLAENKRFVVKKPCKKFKRFYLDFFFIRHPQCRGFLAFSRLNNFYFFFFCTTFGILVFFFEFYSRLFYFETEIKRIVLGLRTRVFAVSHVIVVPRQPVRMWRNSGHVSV